MVKRQFHWMTGVRLILLLLLIWQWGGAAWITAKAQLAQWLLQRAWGETLELQSESVKPWPWADTWPVARLWVPGQKVDLYVLAGAQGNSLAFGPGHMHGTALPGEGVSVIGGHRDTHFGFLQQVAAGEEILLQTSAGNLVRYRVQSAEVVDSRHQPLLINPHGRGLVLVTCYPFDALSPRGPLRYVIWAEEVTAFTHAI